MREVKIGEKTLIIVASTMGVYYHNREFSTPIKEADVMQDASQLVAAVSSGRAPSGIILCRLLWTMARSAQHGKPFPDFPSWIEGFDIDLVDSKLWTDVVDEVMTGFFRATATEPAKEEDGADSAGERPAASDAPHRKAHRAVL